MKDPYKVLGVSPQADDEEIKRAYRELAKKYHPDNYANTEFADIANDKMQEINEAYDAILHQRAGGQSGYGASYGSSYNSSANLSRIRQLIVAGRYHEAEVYLENEQARPAEWYYLKGLCAAGRRAYNDAAENFGRASRMEPTNAEYANMYHRFRGAQQNFGNFTSAGNINTCSMCDVCSGLICADCLCECCGGDLISCC